MYELVHFQFAVQPFSQMFNSAADLAAMNASPGGRVKQFV